jgi:hypothetical protein
MRISQLESFTSLELATLLYIVNELSPVEPKIQFTPKLLLSFKNEKLIEKLTSVHEKANDEGKAVLTSIGGKLQKTWIDEVGEHERASKPLYLQLEFNFNGTTP